MSLVSGADEPRTTFRVKGSDPEMLVVHPNLICPPRPTVIQAEIDEMASLAWRTYSDAVMAFQERRTAQTAAAMSLAFGRFVSLFVPEATDA